MSTTFSLGQANDGTTQLARITVPDTGRNEKADAPIVLIEKDGDKITLFVFSDIQSREATHEISLSGALLTRKKAIPVAAPEVKDASTVPG